MLPGTGAGTTGSAVGESDARAGVCPNCAERLRGRYCVACGQDQQADRSVRALLSAFIDDALDVDARVWRTLRLLLTRPGFLSAEHRAGRRARYLPPVRLYLISSVLFFTMIALAPEGAVRVGATEMTPAEGVAAEGAPGAAAVREPGLEGSAGTEAPGWFEARLDRASRDPERLEDMFLGSFAWVMFALIPIFALLFALLYRGQGMLYVQHLVFALHYHAFAFLTQAVGFALVHVGGTVGVAAILSPHGANALYLYLGARRFYGAGRLATLARVAGVGFTYVLVISAGMAATLFVLVLVLPV